ncbi:MAG: hypothetical protein NZ899_13225 [Thermoguttaceae bacterium]|nr:hypothetical protein [Thermoguttaceae bacterium]MDW8080069.1 hypothetical protein [Thermoguttaceae bacterium]
MQSSLLGFAQVVIEENFSKFFGGLLIVDTSGDPKEFRCTSPVQPSVLQQILWGETLRRHVLSKVLLPALVKELQLLPKAILVQHREFLEARNQLEMPIVRVRRAESGDQPLAPSLTYAATRVDLGSQGTESFILECGVDHSADLETVKPLIVKFHQNCFLLEPFKRVEQAIKILKQKLERGPAT